MAQYNRYTILPHATYDQWRSATLGSGFNVDGLYGNQCWDYLANLWYQYGLTLYTRPGGGGAADCWTVSRNLNAVGPFKAITGRTNIKRGDVIVTNRYSGSSTGHICIADEDYNGTGQIWTIGQVPSLHGQGGVVSRDRWSLTHFLGVFRNTNWEAVPPTPGPSGIVKRRKNFPWVVAWNNWDGFKH